MVVAVGEARLAAAEEEEEEEAEAEAARGRRVAQAAEARRVRMRLSLSCCPSCYCLSPSRGRQGKARSYTYPFFKKAGARAPAKWFGGRERASVDQCSAFCFFLFFFWRWRLSFFFPSVLKCCFFFRGFIFFYHKIVASIFSRARKLEES